ncbi:MAG: hypothetical protein V3S06_05285 [candidate division Zixibacteria bacterium]
MKKTSKISLLAGIIFSISCSWVDATNPVEESGNLLAELSGQSVFEIRGSTNLQGAIRILSRQTSNVKIAFDKMAKASSEAESRRFLDLIDFKLQVEDDRVVFKILSPSHAPWEGSDHSVRVEIFVELPEKMSIEGKFDFMVVNIGGPFQGVDLESGFSNISVERIFGPVEIVTTYGYIQLHAIKGRLRAETQNGKISVSDIIIPSGYALLQSSNGMIRLQDIQGPVEAYTSYAEINAIDIEAPDGSVVLRTSYAPIKVQRVRGELIFETSYGPMEIVDVSINHGQSRFETSHAPITARFIDISNCELYIANDYNGIDLSIPRDISAVLVASVSEGGRISTRNLSLKPTVLNLTRLEALLGDGDSRIEVKVSGIGSINVNGQ